MTHSIFQGKKYYLMIILFILLLPACNKNNNNDHYSGKLTEIEQIFSNQYQCDSVSLQQIGIERAEGIDYDGTSVYISDGTHKQILQFDQHWKKTGEISSSRCSRPGLLAHNQKHLAILDTATNQICLLTKENEQMEQIVPLPPIQPESHYIDMDMNHDFIFLTLATPNKQDARIIQIRIRDFKITKIASDFYGFVALSKENIYFVNSLVAFQDDKREGFESGRNSLWVLKNGSLTRTGDLIEKSCPGDFLLPDQTLIQYTSGWSSIDRYDKNFHYLDSIATFRSSDLETQLKGNNKRMILFMPNEQKLFEVRLK